TISKSGGRGRRKKWDQATTQPKTPRATNTPPISATFRGFMAFLPNRDGTARPLTTRGRTIRQGFAETCGQRRKELGTSSDGPAAFDPKHPCGGLQPITFCPRRTASKRACTTRYRRATWA